MGYDAKDRKTVALHLEAAMAGDQDAKDAVILACDGLINTLAGRWHGQGIDHADLTQAGVFGVYAALERYNPAYKVVFFTYATPWIARYVRVEAHVGRGHGTLSNRARMRLRRYRNAAGNLNHQLGRPPKPEEVASALHWTPQMLATWGSAKTMDQRYHGAAGWEGPGGPLETLAAPQVHPDVDDDKETVAKLLKALPVKWQLVLSLRLGLDPSAPAMTLAEVGERVGLTRERVRQLEKAALARIRRGFGIVADDKNVKLSVGRAQSVAVTARLKLKTLANRKSIPRPRW